MTTPATAWLFKKLVWNVESSIRENSYYDVNAEDMLDLRDNLWTIHDGYFEGGAEEDGDGDD